MSPVIHRTLSLLVVGAAVAGIAAAAYARADRAGRASDAARADSEERALQPIRADSFTGYASIAELLANVGPGKPYCEFIEASRLALDGRVTYEGHQTVRVDQPAGSSGIARLTTCFASRNFWFRIKLRFSPGWTTAGSNASSANSFKLFGWWWGEGDGRGDLEITNTTQYQLHFGPQFGGAQFVSVDAGTVTSEWSDGGWYDYVIHYQVAGNATRTRWWWARDGQTPVLRATALGAVPATAQGVGFPFYFNQTLRAPQSLWIGRWEVVDGGEPWEMR